MRLNTGAFMRSHAAPSLLLLALLSCTGGARATTLTYLVRAGEKACFHAWVDEIGQKVAFYFAVRWGFKFYC